MATEEYQVGYEAGYQDGWNAAQQPQAEAVPRLTNEELRQVWYDDAPVLGGTYIDKLRQVEVALIAKWSKTKRAKMGVVQWLPIETAPRGGRILVKTIEIGLCVASAGWDNETPEKIRWEVVNDIEVNPTHWMPLPPPPIVGKEDQTKPEGLK